MNHLKPDIYHRLNWVGDVKSKFPLKIREYDCNDESDKYLYPTMSWYAATSFLSHICVISGQAIEEVLIIHAML